MKEIKRRNEKEKFKSDPILMTVIEKKKKRIDKRTFKSSLEAKHK